MRTVGIKAGVDNVAIVSAASALLDEGAAGDAPNVGFVVGGGLTEGNSRVRTGLLPVNSSANIARTVNAKSGTIAGEYISRHATSNATLAQGRTVTQVSLQRNQTAWRPAYTPAA